MATWIYDDGGRKVAGFRGSASDCVVRAAAIVTDRPYRELYSLANYLGKDERDAPASMGRRSSARTGMRKRSTREFFELLGFDWHPTMGFGTGCRVHLRADELPAGRIVAKCSRHVVAVVDGVIHDTFDPSRGGSRCVYGYWSL